MRAPGPALHARDGAEARADELPPVGGSVLRGRRRHRRPHQGAGASGRRPSASAALAMEAREEMKLRHAPLLVVREMARHEKHRMLVAETLDRVIQRPDEMTELLAIYWADALGPMQQRKRQPVSAQIKKGLARALTKFDAYQLAKYDRDGAVRIKEFCSLSTPSRRMRTRRRSGKSSSTASCLHPTPGRFRSRPAKTSARPSNG